MDVLATEFLVDGSALSMLAADTTGNVFSLCTTLKAPSRGKGRSS